MSRPAHPFIGQFASARRLGGSADRYEMDSGIVDLPIRYSGACMAVVLLPADARKLRELLPVGYQPCRIGPGRAALVLQFVSFPESSIGAYRESVVGILCRAHQNWTGESLADFQPSPAYALWLSVTSKLARDSGQAIWGYPKELAPTRVEIGESLEAEVSLPGGAFLRCRAPLASRTVAMSTSIRSVTCLDRKIAHTTITGVADLGEEPVATCRLDIGRGSAITDFLAGLEIDLDRAHTTVLRDYECALPPPVLYPEDAP
jgi:hypothetical protein